MIIMCLQDNKCNRLWRRKSSLCNSKILDSAELGIMIPKSEDVFNKEILPADGQSFKGRIEGEICLLTDSPYRILRVSFLSFFPPPPSFTHSLSHNRLLSFLLPLIAIFLFCRFFQIERYILFRSNVFHHNSSKKGHLEDLNAIAS